MIAEFLVRDCYLKRLWHRGQIDLLDYQWKAKLPFHLPVFETLGVLFVSGKTANNSKQTVFPACGLTMELL